MPISGRLGSRLTTVAVLASACLAATVCSAKQPFGPYPPAAPETLSPLPDDRVLVSMVFPVVGQVRWHDSYNEVRGTYRHTGVDICAPKMRPVLAPISGRLGLKFYSFWIVGEGKWQGWSVLGTHLNDDSPGTSDGKCDLDLMFAPNLIPGERVEAGQLIGYVGDSGIATGPHLHLELHGPDGIRDPTPSLNRARRLEAPRCFRARPEEAPAAGEVRLDGCPRSFDPERRVLTLQMVARQAAGEPPVAVARPQRSRAVLTEEAVRALGGAEAVRALPRDRVIRVYVTKANNTVTASRVGVDTGPAQRSASATR